MTKKELRTVLVGAYKLLQTADDKKVFMTKLVNSLAVSGVNHNDVFEAKCDMNPFDHIYKFMSVVEDVLYRAHQRAHQAKIARGTRPLTINEVRNQNNLIFNNTNIR